MYCISVDKYIFFNGRMVLSIRVLPNVLIEDLRHDANLKSALKYYKKINNYDGVEQN